MVIAAGLELELLISEPKLLATKLILKLITTNKIFKNCAPFTECISKINNTQVDHARDFDVAMLMYNLIQYSNNYSRTSESLWQYYRDEPNATLTNSESLTFKARITGSTPDHDSNTKDVKITVNIKIPNQFGGETLEMPLINCEINLILTWSENCVISSANGKPPFLTQITM